ncbi:Uu.00g115070.m01.CDS01 [Anthostomella pinea]|uniref:Uu.00g115070.m01.CDS01 n=1 Tax=Anthostomella pinea TaxID=933095 RepID=A0AAI8VFT4_9PEZI|nr:Uu.00g115070.m01.CDS01 [Anthostomella pinea]
MQFTCLLVAVTALALGTNAGVIARDGARLAQIRVFGGTDCVEQNDGFYTIDQSDADTCKTFEGVDAPISSVKLEVQNSPAADGCQLYVYTDESCTAGRRALALETCSDASEVGTWGSWKLSCGGGSA